MIKIVPSILTNDPNKLRETLKICEGIADRVQIDIVDGEYANNKTIDPIALANIETELLLDFHLMVKNPINWIEKCANMQADRIVAQIEMMKSQSEFIGKVIERGIKVGLAIDLDTKVDAIDIDIINDLDVVLVMSVAAGFGGQKFEPKVLEKFDELDKIRMHDDTPFKICDDGGVSFEYIDDLRIKGVDEAAIGERLFEGNIKDNIEKFIKAAYK